MILFKLNNNFNKLINNLIKNKIFQHNSILLWGKTFSFTPEETKVDDLIKACVAIKFILFIEKTDLVSYICAY